MTEQTPQHLRLVASNDDNGDTPASPHPEFQARPRIKLNAAQHVTIVSIIAQNVETLQQAGLLSVADMNQIFHKVGIPDHRAPEPPLAS